MYHEVGGVFGMYGEDNKCM